MNYQIDITVGENWSEFANTHQREHARKIADMLLKDNYVVRISKINSVLEFGAVEYRSFKLTKI